MDHQFFPTPKSLAAKAWNMFENQDFGRILEPSAGEGALIEAFEDTFPHWRAEFDVCEIDIRKHAHLNELRRVTVVGTDFLQFKDGAYYSHVIMNPPFAYGAEHVLHAWDILFSGEIVAILNAETVRNPYSRQRQRLLSLIEEHGRLEFAGRAFSVSESADVERPADVEVVLVHLKKPEPRDTYRADILEEMLQGLRSDTAAEDINRTRIDVGDHELALPRDFVEDIVLRFNAAVDAMKEAVLAQARAANYARRLADAFEESSLEDKHTAESVRGEWHKRYIKLKERAWRHLLKSTKVQQKLSSSAQLDYPHITDALRSVVLMTTRGYTHGVSFEAPAERVPAIADKWAEVYGTQLPAWKRHQRKSKGLPVAWACSMPVPGQPARRRLVLLCAGLDASKLDARSPWLREHWLPIERLELGDYIVARDKRDRGDWAWTVRLTPRCMRGTEALYRSLAAQSLEQLRYQIERDVRYHPLFGGVRRQMRRLVRGYAKLWSKRTGKPWPGPDPEKLPALGAFTRTRNAKPDATN